MISYSCNNFYSDTSCSGTQYFDDVDWATGSNYLKWFSSAEHQVTKKQKAG